MRVMVCWFARSPITYWVCLFQVFSSLFYLSCQAEQGNYTAVNRDGRYVYGVWNCRTTKAAQTLSNQIAQTRTAASPLPVTTTTKPIELLPADGEVAHWVRSRKPSTYVGQELYKDVIGGHPELYHTYGFVEGATVEYQTPQLGSSPLVLVELFDMGSSENAFGLYSRIRYPQDEFEWVGSQAIISGRQLSFWKGKYFIQIEGYEFAGRIKQGMIELAKATARRIQEPLTKPHLLTRLPPQSQVPHSERYFPSVSALKEIHRFLPDRLLALNANATGASAAYLHEKSSTDWIDTMIAFVIRYEMEAEAEAAYESYRIDLETDAISVDSTEAGGIIAKFPQKMKK